ncbi:MAG: hypothetical protein R3B99_23520 [Polyangiales bacterium]
MSRHLQPGRHERIDAIRRRRAELFSVVATEGGAVRFVVAALAVQSAVADLEGDDLGAVVARVSAVAGSKALERRGAVGRTEKLTDVAARTLDEAGVEAASVFVELVEGVGKPTVLREEAALAELPDERLGGVGGAGDQGECEENQAKTHLSELAVPDASGNLGGWARSVQPSAQTGFRARARFSFEASEVLQSPGVFWGPLTIRGEGRER